MTKKQKRFVEEYLIDLNATQAAIRAGYSPDTAGSIGNENLKKPEICACVEKAMAERSKRTGVCADRVVQELAKIAFLNLRDLIDPKTAAVREDASDEDTAALQSIKVKKSYSETGESIEREAKAADKLKALELLGRHLGMWNDKLNVNGVEGVVIVNDIPKPDTG